MSTLPPVSALERGLPFSGDAPAGQRVRRLPGHQPPGDVRDIEYIAFMRPNFDLYPDFPNLKAMGTPVCLEDCKQ